jgi:phosphoribosylformylglycinamidine synthase
LNFGNPYHPEVYWQFVHAIKGMGDACRVFDTPVTGGNVSFYNQSNVGGITEPVFPTPTIGMIGLLENKNKNMGLAFKAGAKIALLGQDCNELNSSEYLYSFLGIKNSPAPSLNLQEELKLHNLIRSLIEKALINSAHDCSEGGLFICLLESAMAGNTGVDISLPSDIRKDFYLFGESQGRIVVSFDESSENFVRELALASNVPFRVLGSSSGDEVFINNQSFGKISKFRNIYSLGITKHMKNANDAV